jgi:ABC-type branched-subunit amino acid transport system ATPase component
MATTTPILDINGLDVFYGRAHALQNINLRLESGVLAVVGRNGMGKTTLCNAITGLVASTGSIRLAGKEIRGLTPNRIAESGIGYVPQGRRVWPSLSVDEHLRLASKSARSGEWTVQRIYEIFPRLAERRRNGGAQLSGGEQQMLAIGRALLLNPQLLVMDEPTEGLAPVIVDQVAAMLTRLAHEGGVSVLLVEQNLGVAVDVADNVAVVVNGRIARTMPASELARDTVLQQRLLGVRAGADADDEVATTAPEEWGDDMVEILTIRRAGDSDIPEMAQPVTQSTFATDAVSERPRPRLAFTQWNTGNPLAAQDDATNDRSSAPQHADSLAAEGEAESASIVALPIAVTLRSAAYIAGTFDTKGRELMFMRNCLDRAGIRTITVDLSTSGKPSSANVSPAEVARHHPKGASGVFTNDRGSAVGAMAIAFERFIATRRDVGGLISAGGSGGTTLATQAMRRLPIGIPKVMVSTVASGDVKAYVGPADICMMYAVTDVSGINRISEQVLSNAAYALAGMLANRRKDSSTATKPAIGLTMFGVTTPCVQALRLPHLSRHRHRRAVDGKTGRFWIA